jgi:hypothetical protein
MRHQSSNSAKSRQPNPSAAVTPKYLSWEFDLDQRELRRLLRLRFRKRKKYYWQFKGTEAKRLRKYLRTVLGNGRGARS